MITKSGVKAIFIGEANLADNWSWEVISCSTRKYNSYIFPFIATPLNSSSRKVCISLYARFLKNVRGIVKNTGSEADNNKAQF